MGAFALVIDKVDSQRLSEQIAREDRIGARVDQSSELPHALIGTNGRNTDSPSLVD
jgi:hypothetical protein